ncbi:MAG TPA: LD-carboxypeptidase [Candidatus Aminicenantes bacterium]|nr:LD-carboxypeptidase [Candidatus Aminicenantes bacterium]HRY65812.1 LD-carboxypeptidase [Candidatus Aminicenantes bacterium]HRZ72726.1 LD-carboxypeptidase [Candidatus Aminicenantes bacterium]
MTYEKIGFIAPSTCLSVKERPVLNRTARRLRQALGVRSVYLSPHLFSSDVEIDHVTAPVDDRAAVFKEAIRELDLIISVAGGTGAEDLIRKIDAKDLRVIRTRRPLFVGFSDFTFLLNEIYHACRVPVIYFPSLKVGKGDFRNLLALINGQEIEYKGSAWLTPPPPRRLSGIPIGGNLSTFVNFLNRGHPPRFSWRRHILFIEDVQVDVEDVHRLLAALRRHDVFAGIKGLVIGSLTPPGKGQYWRKEQRESVRFVRSYLADVIQERRRRGDPLPILTVTNFGHDIRRNLMAVPIGGKVTISRSKRIVFLLNRRSPRNHWAA